MITYKVENVQYADSTDGNVGLRIVGHCLSTDEKPDGFANGSELVEIDTGDIYLYDEAGESWTKQGAENGTE